jgi:hypothetical protein
MLAAPHTGDLIAPAGLLHRVATAGARLRKGKREGRRECE